MSDSHALNAQLVAAVGEGDLARVSRLLDQGASANAVDNVTYPNVTAWFRDTPVLYAACKMQRADIVALLLGRGADPNAALTGYENMLHEEIPCLFMAFPSVAIVEMLLEAGANPNIPRWQREDASWDRFALDEAPTEELKALLRRYGARG